MTKIMMSFASTIGPQMTPVTSPDPPMPTFAEIKASVMAADSMPEGTRKNILRAVDLVAQQMGAVGLQARIDIAAIQRKFEEITPAMLGFQSACSLASMMSNFRRAHLLSGVSVMPGKSHARLSERWAALRDAAAAHKFWPALSRFAHFCAERNVELDAVGPADLARFVEEVRRTSLKSRGEKVERQFARAWTSARTRIAIWPSSPLPIRPRTGRLLRLYRDSFRAFHAAGCEASWLFPRSDGTHWPTTAANRTLQDLTAKHIGFMPAGCHPPHVRPQIRRRSTRWAWRTWRRRWTRGTLSPTRPPGRTASCSRC